MPIYSMTGYATASSNSTDQPSLQTNALPNITIEARSVNSRFLDPHFRMPDEIRACEPTLRTLITNKLRRGKVEVRITINQVNDQIVTEIPTEALQNLSKLSAIVRNWLPDVTPLSVTDVLRLSQTPIILDEVQEQITDVATQALDKLMESRAQEGKRLGDSILERTKGLRALAQKAAPLIPQVIEQQRQRFLERWEQALSQAGAQSAISSDALQERALAEATSYALRIDVSEEITRLGSHLDEIDRLIKQGGEAGKRLDFLIQELHREANTLGSKATSIDLTQISVEMKVLVEQMREQVQNIE